MSKLRILYVASEVDPFLSTTQVADFVRKLPAAMQEKGMEIRILVPRFGLINERKNRLHEVVRLSGFTVPVGDDDKPVTIKVASLPSAKLQVYFIDNEDYFQRKTVFTDKEDNFYSDNDERAIFFCKGSLETVKKLRWAPDIVHCNDWMTSLVPLYLKTTYKNDPMFKDAKVVFSVYNSAFSHKFEATSLYEKVKLMDIEDTMLDSLKTADYAGFIKIGAEYADTVITSEEEVTEKFNTIVDELPDKKIEFVPEENIESYYNLYTDLASA
ncbi:MULTISPECIES: glycogen/starch synthase [Flectobacillus]|jgi:starch synthase|uniref:starch synthase n=2 Tax=Flectobacillus TaxID=101 RepID=A0ABT6Z394_9BACT|nr:MULTISPECIES: glycogen/starch synthase [Flectobacillus]NBA78662.1 glycogen synthase [Emticicia sp. ODNR4P]MDI9858820.1 glycogen/starch synthase [Flectobacillus roseus]MDI9870109.1 glycogen/starch synthase [Flectobacillus roseus]MDI9875598.1 glycogen/starch synthase [Flectobacillus rivi]PAC27907.1 glycogen synthase [Flectobacillus sp. BAB-3569]